MPANPKAPNPKTPKPKTPKPKTPEKADAACTLLTEALGDWWNDERRRWCAYCGIAMKLRCATGKPVPPNRATRDHVIPKKHNGGLVTIPACRACNEAKGALSLPEFLLSGHFARTRKQNHRNRWPIDQLWIVAALAAVKQTLPRQPRRAARRRKAA